MSLDSLSLSLQSATTEFSTKMVNFAQRFPCAVSSTSSSSSIDRQIRRQGFKEFSHLLVSTVETRLGLQLLPDPLPPRRVQYY
uniref:Uncharacterized protein n=1 Tax=Nelumbo nucifera TaxID=4432 RepID=A0A822Y120_NELNU|nr:TPA_asm: hypothetical protein HUJ06_027625 [Nelumbo nucifera]